MRKKFYRCCFIVLFTYSCFDQALCMKRLVKAGTGLRFSNRTFSTHQKQTFSRLVKQCRVSEKDRKTVEGLVKKYDDQVTQVTREQRDKFTKSWLLNLFSEHKNSMLTKLASKEFWIDQLPLLGLGIGTMLLAIIVPSGLILAIYIICLVTGDKHNMKRIERFVRTGKFDEEVID